MRFLLTKLNVQEIFQMKVTLKVPIAIKLLLWLLFSEE